MAGKQQKWAIGGAALVVLMLFASCNDDETDNSGSGSRTGAAALVPLKDQPVWSGTVDTYGGDYHSPVLRVNLGGNHFESVVLAHVGTPSCKHFADRDETTAAVLSRLSQLAPPGTEVTIVRGTKQIGRTIDFSQDGFVYLADALDAEPVASTTREPVSSTPTTAPSTTTSVTTRSVTAPTSEAPDPDLPTGTSSLNETILAEGLGSLVNPDINLSAVASNTVEEQMYSGYAPLELEPSISLFPRLLDAHRTAWDGHVGFQADCRAKEADDVLKKQRDDELSRVRRGPDGEFGTSDDDFRNWRYNEQGELYLDTSGGGGSGGGGGWGGRCRGRFC
ncbi:hypothetical protein [Rhodococcus opacus]|uniref:hypothetical protein n=1 Tax=Rhodococcus opacus TaxID=37919 RepID=UPI001F586835|nr:hypothetical protein [Rhodococcus opacus]UNN05007.1 hypothetical protein MOO23_39270 [Rhodococcus opacus]